jgi:two-component system sensor histidine kinase CpxA
MEQDVECLNEMIGRLLIIARLDTATAPVQMISVNLTELVSHIVYDAGFESQKRDVAVTLKASEQFFVRGNAELLHSAIENVIRNAIRYTASGTQVEAALQGKEIEGVSFVSLAIRDCGPGVVESDLINIFQPFYRVADARDRQSGGAGLGLAIADRVIRIHKGTIHAENTTPQGLQINIVLPEL